MARHSAAHRAQCRLCSPGRGPISLHERAHGTDRAEKLRASADGEPHIGELCHIGIGARSGLSQHDLFEIRSELQPRGGRRRQLIRSGFNIARPAQHRRWAVDGGDAWVALKLPGQLLQRAQELRVQCVAGWRLQPELNGIERIRLLEIASILGHALARIDVGQRVSLESEGCDHVRNAEQNSRSAQH